MRKPSQMELIKFLSSIENNITEKGGQFLSKGFGDVSFSSWLDNYWNPQYAVGSPSINNRGSVGEFINKAYHPKLCIMSPSADDLQSIDDFFEDFGIRINKYGKPNLAVRPTFTFVKTRGAIVKGSHKQACIELENMLNTGTRFHKGEIK